MGDTPYHYLFGTVTKCLYHKKEESYVYKGFCLVWLECQRGVGARKHERFIREVFLSVPIDRSGRLYSDWGNLFFLNVYVRIFVENEISR